MGKSNRRKRELQREHQSFGDPNPLLYTSDPWRPYMAPILTLPGKPPHRICRGKP